MAKYTKIPTNAFKEIQMNAGVMLKSFDVATATIKADDIICATSGGINVTATPSFTDYGEDIDNCPKNTKELKKLESWEIKASGTAVTVTATLAKSLAGVADVDGNHVTLRNDVDLNDFEDLWIVADYSEYNGESNGGFVACHLSNALSTGGFQMQTSDKAKGQFSFEYTAHYSMDDQDAVPFEIYVKAGTEEAKTKSASTTD